MSKFICQSCPERCSLFCAQNASEIPTRCQYTGKANWERVVEENTPIYYTLPAPTPEPEIDYKKAFETAMKEIKSINTYVCKFCVARYYCLDKRHTKLCWGCIEEAIKRKCTKGGE